MPLATAPNAALPVGGLRKRAKDALAGTADMKPEDWADLVGGFLKFIGEEAEESEHAEDEAEAPKIDPSHDGPWMSCMSKDGKTMYVHRSLPADAEIAGKRVIIPDILIHHEVPEWERLQRILAAFKDAHGREPTDQEREAIYTEAHETAGTPAEKAFCEGQGIDWAAWSAWCRGEEAKIEKLNPENQPTDADVKPMPHNHGELEATGNAADSRDRLALDRASVRSFDEDGRMRVAVTNISKANISPYRGDEIPGWDAETKTHVLGLDPDKIYKMFRAPEDLAKSVKTWNGIQLLRKHVPVDIDDHKKYDIVGTTGTNAEFVDPYLRNSLVLWSKEGIDLVESGEQKELSCGYHYDPDMTPGSYNGEPYDGVMRNIRGNHVALVEEGRVGSDVIVADTVVEMQWAIVEEALLNAWAA